MNGLIEPLPGLLDDPQFSIPNLSGLPDVHIAPLRNPAPVRHNNVPLPLEPLAKSLEERRLGTRNKNYLEEEPERISPPRLRPSDVLLAREAKKPHLAISELLEASNGADTQHLQLPSFVSLAVVERSPVQEPSSLSPHKRLRLDLDIGQPSRDVGRRLPRPAQKDEKQPRPVPLLPAMVTGLHEPPPSAGILPSMDLDARPSLANRSGKTPKIQVKDMLSEAKQSSTHVPPEAMLNTPDLSPAELAMPQLDETRPQDEPATVHTQESAAAVPKKDTKARRARRKWSHDETVDLLAGVQKHGFGKWKQIMNDSTFTFHDRTSIDLKDRYRVYVKDQPENSVLPLHPPARLQHETSSSAKSEANSSKSTTDASESAKPKRKRRPWTAAEDACLMRGLSKYGFQWTTIHEDEELGLEHRRATDLRDRVRNLFPDGYKHAEARPLKSEVKKTVKSIQTIDTTANEAKIKNTEEGTEAVTNDSTESVGRPSSKSQEKRRAHHSKVQKCGGDVQQIAEQGGVTLPSLALDDDDELDWGDNTLPPLLEWDEIGM